MDPDRLVFTAQTEWINHTWVKGTADLALDARLKNGHTTVLDEVRVGSGLAERFQCGPLMRSATCCIASSGMHVG